MLVSSFALYTSVDNLMKEVESYKRILQITGSPVNSATSSKYIATVRLILSILFFIVELYVLYYMLRYVFGTTDAGPGRNVKVILLVFFSVPYTLLTAVIDPNFSDTVDTITAAKSR